MTRLPRNKWISISRWGELLRHAPEYGNAWELGGLIILASSIRVGNQGAYICDGFTDLSKPPREADVGYATIFCAADFDGDDFDPVSIRAQADGFDGEWEDVRADDECLIFKWKHSSPVEPTHFMWLTLTAGWGK